MCSVSKQNKVSVRVRVKVRVTLSLSKDYSWCKIRLPSLTTFDKEFNATYRMLLSRFNKKRPRMFTANTRRPESLSMPMMVCTHSYRMAFPAFFDVSVVLIQG